MNNDLRGDVLLIHWYFLLRSRRIILLWLWWLWYGSSWFLLQMNLLFHLLFPRDILGNVKIPWEEWSLFLSRWLSCQHCVLTKFFWWFEEAIKQWIANVCKVIFELTLGASLYGSIIIHNKMLWSGCEGWIWLRCRSCWFFSKVP